MPSRLASPVITVDINHIAKVDPSNVDNLFSMWTIFSKCAESLENGRRLENLSWRLWNRETLCCESKDATSDEKNLSIPQHPKRQNSETFTDIPELSSSVESASSEEDLTKERPEGVGIKPVRPCLVRGDSSETHRGKEKHMTPVDLVKIMEDIDKNKSNAESWISRRHSGSLHTREAPKPSVPIMSSSHPVAGSSDDSSPKNGLRSSHSVVRGFSPGRTSSSYRSSTSMAPDPSPLKPPPAQPKKKQPVFFLGSSSSYSDDGADDSYSSRRGNRSSKSSDAPKRSSAEKRTSFRDEVATRTVYDDDATTDDDEGISESAIEDEDSEWESSSESMHSSYDENGMFKRVDSRPQLTSRRSLLSTMLHEPDRAVALANAASKSTPVLRKRPSPPLPQYDTPARSAAIPQSKPIMAAANPYPPAFSPRTTRRNMLATELTESLRHHMLWERRPRGAATASDLKRRHTSHDVKNLMDYPQPYPQKQTSKNNSWNHYFDQGQHEYHHAGW